MIPIIAMSAKDAREDMDACKEAGMNDYLAKPVEPQRLYQVLAEYLKNPMWVFGQSAEAVRCKKNDVYWLLK